ncbi:MAG: MBL fold metallo-hydrolase [Phycisphaerales bacterium]|nr:MBL fold metallo-hydrolase [Phycisphaerales bacterium]
MSAAICNATLELLGTGTSSGIPAIGCACPACTSNDPRDTRTRTSGALQFTDASGVARVLLLDVSPDHRAQALRAQLKRCDGILLTHSHVDHVFGLDEVRRYNVLMKGAPIEVFADSATHEDLRRMFRHIFESHLNPNDSFVASLMPRELKGSVPFDLHGVRVTPFEVPHGNSTVMAFRFDAPESSSGEFRSGGLFPLAYCTDISAVPDHAWPHLAGVQTLVLDMLRERFHPTHLSLSQALEVAQRVGARRTVFVHMAHDVLHAAWEGRLPAGVELGYDGLVIR